MHKLYNNYHKVNVTGLSKHYVTVYRLGNKLYSKRKNSIWIKIGHFYLRKIARILGAVLNCYLPFGATIGDNIVLPHGLYGVFISKNSVIGNNVLIMHQVTIGSNGHIGKSMDAPVIGDHVFVGAGAKIIGGISIGSNSIIGANAVVVKNIPENAKVVAPSEIREK